MMKYDVQINENTNQRDADICREYWFREDPDTVIFKHKTLDIIKRYGITQRDLTAIVRENSQFVFLEKCCTVCNEGKAARVRTDIAGMKGNRAFVCDDCKKSIEEQRVFEQANRLEIVYQKIQAVRQSMFADKPALNDIKPLPKLVLAYLYHYHANCFNATGDISTSGLPGKPFTADEQFTNYLFEQLFNNKLITFSKNAEDCDVVFDEESTYGMRPGSYAPLEFTHSDEDLAGLWKEVNTTEWIKSFLIDYPRFLPVLIGVTVEAELRDYYNLLTETYFGKGFFSNNVQQELRMINNDFGLSVGYYIIWKTMRWMSESINEGKLHRLDANRYLHKYLRNRHKWTLDLQDQGKEMSSFSREKSLERSFLSEHFIDKLAYIDEALFSYTAESVEAHIVTRYTKGCDILPVD